MSGTEAPSTSSAVAPKHTNRLINEKSPYLLQHAHNPVDWYSWCDEAIERARKENKLIFLSVGYSTCHWCHVMEHESFENEEVAAIMNEHYINIKVDREERPDIDKIYMHIVVMLNDSGGWPMSVWLTPDLAPVTAGTYFPPTNRYGMPAFRTILLSIANKWKEDEQKLRNTGLKVVDLMRKNIDANQPARSEQVQAHDLGVETKLTDALQIYKRRFDSINGGFGFSPKFPEAPRLNLLFHAYLAHKKLDVLQMALTTLEKIAEGGIHDHIGGGFSRYAVDALWHVPHFEKMLYDQGQLMSAYAIAYKLTAENKFLVAAQGIYRYLLRDLRHELGGFYAGEDADSLPDWQSKKKVEGAFYVWQLNEITDIMQENAALYAELKLTIDEIAKIYAGYYNIENAGNVDPANDPHEHFSHKNILIIRESMSDMCEKYQITIMQLQQIIEITNQLLLKVRAERPRPHLDNKIICSWNALMLIGLCDLATCATDKQAEYAETARQLYEFMREHFYNEQQQTLIHACYGETDSKSGLSVGQRIEGFLDDYVFLINALLNYYKLTLDQQVLQWARQLQQTQQRLFWDNDKGGYFYSQAQAKSLVLRLKDAEDGAEPSGNSLATRNLLVLSHYFDDKTMSQHAKKTFECFSNNSPFGYIMPQMMAALLLLDQGIDMVAVVGSDAQSKQEYFNILRKYFVPGLVIFDLDPTQQVACIENFSNLQHKYKMVDDKTTVYICHHRVCHMPITEAAQLEKVLQTNYFVPKSA